MQTYMPSMRKEFQTYFPDLNALDSNFICSVWRCDLSQTACMRKFLNDSTAYDAFEALPLTKFLSKMSESYPCVADVPVRNLLMFPFTYRCEQGFSAMFCMKTKKNLFHARLCIKDELRVFLSKTVPRSKPSF